MTRFALLLIIVSCGDSIEEDGNSQKQKNKNKVANFDGGTQPNDRDSVEFTIDQGTHQPGETSSIDTHGVATSLVYIPPGSIKIPQGNDYELDFLRESPTVDTEMKIILPQGVWMSATEVTQELYSAVMKEQPWETTVRPGPPTYEQVVNFVAPGECSNSNFQNEPSCTSAGHSWNLTQTRSQFVAELYETGACFSAEGAEMPQSHPKLPATCINHLSMIQFCNRLSLEHGLEPAYELTYETINEMRHEGEVIREEREYLSEVELKPHATGYRLPTQLEWIFAWNVGEKLRTPDDGEQVLTEMGWVADNSEGRLRPVGQKAATPLGLTDMLGNAREAVWPPDKGGGSFSSPLQLTVFVRSQYLEEFAKEPAAEDTVFKLESPQMVAGYINRVPSFEGSGLSEEGAKGSFPRGMGGGVATGMDGGNRDAELYRQQHGVEEFHGMGGALDLGTLTGFRVRLIRYHDGGRFFSEDNAELTPGLSRAASSTATTVEDWEYVESNMLSYAKHDPSDVRGDLGDAIRGGAAGPGWISPHRMATYGFRIVRNAE